MGSELHAVSAHFVLALPLVRLVLWLPFVGGRRGNTAVRVAVDVTWAGFALLSAVTGQTIVQEATALGGDVGVAQPHGRAATIAIWAVVGAVGVRTWLRLRSRRVRPSAVSLTSARALMVLAGVLVGLAALSGGALLHGSGGISVR